MFFFREDNRVWFFTNERLAGFLNFLPKEIKKVCAIGGSGDFAFNVLSVLGIQSIVDLGANNVRPYRLEEIILCDKKPMAGLVVEFKKELFKKFNFSEIKNLFLGKNGLTSKEMPAPQNILSKEIISRGAGGHSFVKILKKSKFFYNESFRCLKFIDEYLVYLQNEEKYQAMRAQLDKIKFVSGDFSEKLKIFPDNYFDLVCVSNILDSGDYSADNVDCLRTIKQKLTPGGLLLAVIQDKVEKQIGFIEQNGFELMKKEAHKFNFITSLKGHYYFSFALLKSFIE